MTPLTVQMSLIDELKDMFKGYEYKNAKGDMVPLNVYMQDTPIQNILLQRSITKNITDIWTKKKVKSRCLI